MNIIEQIKEIADMLREECNSMTAEECLNMATTEHVWGMGSATNSEAHEHEIRASAYRLLAREK